jgi:cytochrome subunit of sulfide dehydrogenase
MSWTRTLAAVAAAVGTLLPLAAAAQNTPPADMTLARNLAATCANCHGTNGAARGDMKPLAGLPAPAIVAFMNEYKSGNLPATVMHQIAKGYTDEQIRLIAAYFAAQKPAARP